MVAHFIILSSDYCEGTRIGLHYVLKGDASDVPVIKSMTETVGNAFDGKPVSFSTHMVQTDAADWTSVPAKDHYFSTVWIIDDLQKFVGIIRSNREFKGIDVAAYLASQSPYTHTRLEKLAYYCYANYLCTTGKRLFADSIYAFAHGPVVGSVYDTLKEYSKGTGGVLLKFDQQAPDRDDDKPVKVKFKPIEIRSKLRFAEDGSEKVDFIDKTVVRYERYSTADLVEMTHQPDTPWSKAYTGENYRPISDGCILRWHINETALKGRT